MGVLAGDRTTIMNADNAATGVVTIKILIGARFAFQKVNGVPINFSR